MTIISGVVFGEIAPLNQDFYKADKTEILIQATREKVQALLADVDNYKNRNPFIPSVTGEPL